MDQEPETHVLKHRHVGVLAALVGLASAAPRGVGAGTMQGYPASPEERQRRRDARAARAPKALAKAEAKRARKAAQRLASLSSTRGES